MIPRSDSMRHVTSLIQMRLWELFRYVGASAVAFAVDMGTLIFLTEVFQIHYLLSAAIGFVFGVIVIYVISVNWVFHYRRIESRSKENFIFITIGLCGLVFNEGLIFVFTETFDFVYQISKLISSIFIFAFNFLIRKLFLFSSFFDRGN
jgi:putative flippase GtrA